MEKKTERQFAAEEDFGALIPIILQILTNQKENSNEKRGAGVLPSKETLRRQGMLLFGQDKVQRGNY